MQQQAARHQQRMRNGGVTAPADADFSRPARDVQPTHAAHLVRVPEPMCQAKIVGLAQKLQSTDSNAVLERELAYYETLYGTDAASHFAKPAVVAFREYLVERILRLTGAGPESRVLSIGCGVGDTELLLAGHVGHVTGVDLSATAIKEANRAAYEQGVSTVRFVSA